jgi:SAM-dependent methyltransferase
MSEGRTPGRGRPRALRRFDQTYLSENRHGSMVHRDYAAHFFRWGFVFRFCKEKRVIDIGCGPEWNLGRVLINHGRIPLRPEFYVGVDLSPLEPQVITKHRALVGECDFTNPSMASVVADLFGPFDVACCFEVIEHMGVEDASALLRVAKTTVRDGGTLLLSTPVLSSRGPARNHVHEYTVPELRDLVERCGWRVERRFGTYGDVASLRKATREAEDERAVCHLKTMEDLSEYYSNEVLANFLAPLYPDACKNNLWVLEKEK